MKPKEWLKKNGHIETVGRGRLSAAHIALIKEAVANGAIIEGYAATAPVKTADASASAKPTVEKVKTDPNRLVDVPDMRRDERDWSATVKVDGKDREIGFRTVCNGCGSSLGWCYEETSRVWVDSDREAVVTFKPKAQKGAG